MEDKITVMISEEEIDKRTRELGAQISEEYAGKEIHLICILKGSSFFAGDLAKRITCPVTIDFMSLSSYGAGTESSGVVSITKNLEEPIQGKHVLIVEDIIDTGRTLKFLKDILAEQGAASIRIVTLLDKPERRVAPVDVEYTGFTVPDRFIIGYGLDLDQRYRNLPYIGVFEKGTDEEEQQA